jgi:hypothetical protein
LKRSTFTPVSKAPLYLKRNITLKDIKGRPDISVSAVSGVFKKKEVIGAETWERIQGFAEPYNSRSHNITINLKMPLQAISEQPYCRLP